MHNDSIILHNGNPVYIRATLAEDPEFMICLVRFLQEGTLDDYQWHDLRESALLILEQLVQIRGTLLEEMPDSKLALDSLRAKIDQKIKENPGADFNEMIKKELDLTQRVYAAKMAHPGASSST